MSACAKVLGLSLRKAFSVVQHLQKHGLITMTRLEPRPGRAIRHYRAVAQSFFIDKTLISVEQIFEVLGSNLDASLNKHFTNALLEKVGNLGGLQVLVSETGGIGCLLVEAPRLALRLPGSNEVALFNVWHEWKLDFEDAKALQQDLMNLAKKYSVKSMGSQTYLVRLAMTPKA